jgi:hypothetical protein
VQQEVLAVLDHTDEEARDRLAGTGVRVERGLGVKIEAGCPNSGRAAWSCA